MPAATMAVAAMRHLLLLACALPGLHAQTASFRPEHLRVEYRVNPLGIDAMRPRLSWQLAAADPEARNLKQSAYRILGASTPELLRAGKGDLWDSGRVETDRSIQIEY